VFKFPLTGLDGKKYVGVQVLDITDRKRMEREREILIKDLETRNAELERFTYTVSHDLKSPLVTIRGFLGYLEEAIKTGNHAKMKADMNRIVEATNKMQLLLAELLELSRIGRIINPPETALFEQLAFEAVKSVSGQIEQRTIQVEIDRGGPTVYVDRARLVEVLQNLIDNAAKFMGHQSQPKIEIGSRSAGNGLTVFFVRDNGMGIPPQYHDRVFGLFEKLDPRIEGTGIGLAIVKRIIEVHGGRIWVESEGYGKGSTFCFTLSEKQ
jgi:signal transduction histidine kinase